MTHVESLHTRTSVMGWLLTVCATHHVSPLARDSSILILHSFFMTVLGKGEGSRLQDPVVVSHAAAIALTFGFKLHETKRTLHLSSFQQFDVAMLKRFEAEMLLDLASFLAPQVTPSTFVDELLGVWRPGAPDTADADGIALKTDLAAIATAMIGEFFTQPRAVLYAPSTVAIAALILAFSILQRDCADWLAAVPDACLPAIARGAGVDVLYDVDSCLTVFSGVDSLRPPPPASHPSVARAEAGADAAVEGPDASPPLLVAHRSPKVRPFGRRAVFLFNP